MKIVVTGASGFVGRYVVDELDARGINTVACTRSLDVAPESGPTIKWLEQDLNQASDGFYQEIGESDVLIHLAWPGLPNYNSLHHFEEALPNQYLFLRNAVQAGLKSLVVAGTCFEYGMQSGPLSASSKARPENPYGFAKDALRQQLEYLQSKHEFNLTWGRLFYVYGDGQAETSLFPALKKAAENGDSGFKMSSGEQIRDFLPIEDAVKRLVDLALDPKPHRITNICSGKPISVRARVELWIEEYGWDIKPDCGHFLSPKYEPMAFWGVQDNDE